MKFLILTVLLIAFSNCSDPDNEVVKPIPEPPVAVNEVDFGSQKPINLSNFKSNQGSWHLEIPLIITLPLKLMVLQLFNQLMALDLPLPAEVPR